MKNKAIIALLLGILMSCSKSDESSTLNILDGKWHMIKSGCDGGICNVAILATGDVIWDFDLINNILKVERNVDESVVLTTGIYDIDLSPEIDDPYPGFSYSLLNIDIPYFPNWYYYFEDEKLVLVTFVNDGPLLEFVRY